MLRTSHSEPCKILAILLLSLCAFGLPVYAQKVKTGGKLINQSKNEPKSELKESATNSGSSGRTVSSVTAIQYEAPVSEPIRSSAPSSYDYGPAPTPAPVPTRSYDSPTQVTAAPPGMPVPASHDGATVVVEAKPPIPTGINGRKNRQGVNSRPGGLPPGKVHGDATPIRPTPSRHIANIEQVRWDIQELLEEADWSNPAFQEEFHSMITLLDVNINYLPAGTEGADMYQDWSDLYWVEYEEELRNEAFLSEMRQYFDFKARWLPYISLPLNFPLDTAIVDELWNTEEGGYEFLQMICEWNPDEIRWQLGQVHYRNEEYINRGGITYVNQFLTYFVNSDTQKFLDWKINKELGIYNALADSDPTRAILHMENAYFLLSAGNLLAPEHYFWITKLEDLESTSNDLFYLVEDILPAKIEEGTFSGKSIEVNYDNSPPVIPGMGLY